MNAPEISDAARLLLGSALFLLASGLGLAITMSPEHHPLIFVATSAAIGAAIATLALGLRVVRRPVQAVTRAALSMSKGNLDERAPILGDGEVAKLGEALNRLAGELSRSMAALRTERDLLAGILDGMVEGVLVLDADERIVLANRALRAMTLLGEDAIGKPVLEALRNAGLKEALDAATESDEAVVREIEVGRLLPRKVLLRVSRLGALGGAGGSEGKGKDERGVVAVFHDVTDLRRLETIRTDFVANVSHELRTPVTAISTAAETLIAGALDDRAEAGEFVDVIDRHATRLRQLVDDLLDLAKLEEKNFRLVLLDQDLLPILSHVTKLLEEPAKRRRVTMKLPASSGPIKARVDRRGLEQVLTNLLDNAIKYAGEGAIVSLSVESTDGQVMLVVADNGAGIPPAHLGRIFERFYRVDAGRSRELGGTGLGLAIVKHLVELMGGTIGVESEPGKGTRFTIRLQTGDSASGGLGKANGNGRMIPPERPSSRGALRYE